MQERRRVVEPVEFKKTEHGLLLIGLKLSAIDQELGKLKKKVKGKQK